MARTAPTLIDARPSNAMPALRRPSRRAGGVVTTRIIVLLLGVGLLMMRNVEAIAQSTPAAYECAARSDLVGPCFEVHGRLSFWNGAPSARIWPVGTKRFLGVHSDIMPPALAQSHSFDTELWAHFTVCPFTASKPGHMQFVCIESWRDLSIRHRED